MHKECTINLETHKPREIIEWCKKNLPPGSLVETRAYAITHDRYHVKMVFKSDEQAVLMMLANDGIEVVHV